MWFISFVCLAFVSFCCVAAVLSKVFRDNWPQFIGLWLVCLGASSRALDVVRVEYVSTDAFVAHVGLALFAGGTWYKFRRLVLAGISHPTDRHLFGAGTVVKSVFVAALLLSAASPATSVQMAGNVITLDADELHRCRAEGGCAVSTQEAFDAAVQRSVVRQMRTAGKCA